MDTTWPMLIQRIALPIAMQTDRILVSHRGRPGVLAEYNLAFQLFRIALQSISASGVALSPISPGSGRGLRSGTPAKLWLLSSRSASPSLESSPSSALDRRLRLGRLDHPEPDGPRLVCLFVVVQSMKYPLGMYMTDKRAVFQVSPRW